VITLSQPKAYGQIKPLYGSTGEPIRCTPSDVVVAEIENRPNCTDCLTRRYRSSTCDWPALKDAEPEEPEP
jgi:hypothetical protein